MTKSDDLCRAIRERIRKHLAEFHGYLRYVPGGRYLPDLLPEFRRDLAVYARRAWRERNYNWLFSIWAVDWIECRPEVREIRRKQRERAQRRPAQVRTMWHRVTELVTRRYGVAPVNGHVCRQDNVWYHCHDEYRGGRCIRCGTPAKQADRSMLGRKAAIERERILAAIKEKRGQR